MEEGNIAGPRGRARNRHSGGVGGQGAGAKTAAGGSLVLYALVTLFLPGCRAEVKPAAAVTASPVQVVQALQGYFQDELTSFGTLSFRAKTDVAALAEGAVERVAVRDGEAVTAGTVLATLTNPQLLLQLEQAKNGAEQARQTAAAAANRLWEARFSVEGRLLALEKADISIQQKKLEAEKLAVELEASRELFALGGVTKTALASQELSYKGALADLAMLHKERAMAALGLTAADLRAAGITPSADAAKLRAQVVSLNVRGAQAEAEAARGALENAEAALAATENVVAALAVKAPVDGVVGAHYFEAGEWVKLNERVVTLIDVARVYAAFYIQEQDIVHFAVGTPVSVTVMSLGMTVRATIDEIAPVADAGSGNFAVKALLENTVPEAPAVFEGEKAFEEKPEEPEIGSDNSEEAGMPVLETPVLGNLRPGMFVRCALLKGEGANYVTVPESAIREGGIFVVKGTVAVRKEVTVAAVKEGVAFVKAGVDAGEKVVEKPSPFLRDGEAVRLTE